MRKLLIHWDEALDAGFRSRLESALDDLPIDYADAQIDQDADASTHARLAIVASGAPALPHTRDTLLVLAGAGLFPDGATGLRLEIADMETRSRRWMTVADRIGSLVGKPGLAGLIAAGDDADALRRKLVDAEARAAAAERDRAAFELDRNNTARALKHAEAALASERATSDDMRKDMQRLEDLVSSTVFALSFVPPGRQAYVLNARNRAALARLSAAQAAAAAVQHPDALVWSKAHATYSGETRNGRPHGHGLLVFRAGDKVVASYSGVFADGLRLGSGVGISEGGHVWTGDWRHNEACGYGLLETPDGRRFEGEVAPDENGAPQRIETNGHIWPAQPQTPAPAKVHEPVMPLLASPAASGNTPTS